MREDQLREAFYDVLREQEYIDISWAEPYDPPPDWQPSEAVRAVADDLIAAAKKRLVIGEGELDRAWKEAEEALPERWLGPELNPYYPKGFEAGAHHQDATPGRGRGKRDTGAVYGETAAAALHNLAAYLREHHAKPESRR